MVTGAQRGRILCRTFRKKRPRRPLVGELGADRSRVALMDMDARVHPAAGTQGATLTAHVTRARPT